MKREKKDDVDWNKIALVVAFMRRGLKALDRANDKTIIGALIKFGNPMSEMETVSRQSDGIKEAFGKQDAEARSPSSQ